MKLTGVELRRRPRGRRSSGNRCAARALLDSTDRTTEFQQYTNSPHGTY